SAGAARVKTCQDVRYAGAMSNIEYEYVPSSAGQAGLFAVGQIKVERNMTTHEAVSTLDYQSGTFFERTERRPDGATRFFRYDGADGLGSYTDFAYLGQPGQVYHTTTISF